MNRKIFCNTCGGFEDFSPKFKKYKINDNATNACCDKCVVTYRFFQKVRKSELGCWEWTATSRGNGYGALKVNRKVIDAHRLSFELHYGKIGHSRILVRHTCDNRNCVNPNHLVIGTHSENMRDAFIRGRLPLMNRLMAERQERKDRKTAA